MKKVYIDVENTVSVPFKSGIQRVTSEIVNEFSVASFSNYQFYPIKHCDIKNKWYQVPTPLKENGDLVSNSKSAASGFRKIASVLPNSLKSTLKIIYGFHSTQIRGAECNFEEGDIFLDLDSSWHNRLKRSNLLPNLHTMGVKIATLHHDALPVTHPELCHPNTVKVFEDHFSAHVTYSDLILCNSQTTQSSLRRVMQDYFPESSAKTAVIEFGDFQVKPGMISANFKELVKPLGQYLLCVATIEPRKNHNTILNAFDKVRTDYPNLRLVLVGRQGWLSDEIVKRITLHPLYKSQLLWLENVSDSDLTYLYKNAYISVTASLHEGYGLPVSESLSNGCVTLASNRGAIPEVGKDHVIYFDPCNEEELVRAMLNLIDDPRIYAEQKSKVETRKKKSWLATCANIVQELDKL